MMAEIEMVVDGAIVIEEENNELMVSSYSCESVQMGLAGDIPFKWCFSIALSFPV